MNAPISDWCELPQCVEVAIRSGVVNGTTRTTVFLLNYSAELVHIKFNKRATDQITERLLENTVELEPYGVIVITT